MKQKIKERLMLTDGLKVIVAADVEYVDVNNPDHFVPMPDWFRDITTIPGVPYKFITEFAGPPDSGKTTAGMIALINAQKAGAITILVDVERKFHKPRFTEMGGNLEDLYVISELTIEKNFSQLETYMKNIHDEEPEAKILVVYDSIAAGVSNAEMGKDADSAQTIADQAKVIKRYMKRTIVNAQLCNVAAVLINQVYSDPNPMAHGKARLSGGKGVEYSKSLALSFVKKADLKPHTVKGQLYKSGILTQVKTTKNHLQFGNMLLSSLMLEVKDTTMEKVTLDKKSKKSKKSVEIDLSDGEPDDDVESEGGEE